MKYLDSKFCIRFSKTVYYRPESLSVVKLIFYRTFETSININFFNSKPILFLSYVISSFHKKYFEIFHTALVGNLNNLIDYNALLRYYTYGTG